MTDKEREEELVKCLTDLRSRHTRLLIKYINLEDKYNELKDKFDLLTINATNTIYQGFEKPAEEEIETAALTARGKRITEDI